jgi:hypothetical protein
VLLDALGKLVNDLVVKTEGKTWSELGCGCRGQGREKEEAHFII